MDEEVVVPIEDKAPEVEVFANANTASNIELRTVENVMEDSYLRYSMSVIIERALPDVRDGLKQFTAVFSIA